MDIDKMIDKYVNRFNMYSYQLSELMQVSYRSQRYKTVKKVLEILGDVLLDLALYKDCYLHFLTVKDTESGELRWTKAVVEEKKDE